MDTMIVTITALDGGEVLLSGYEFPVPITLGREADTNYLHIATGDGEEYALEYECSEVSRKHCSLGIEEGGVTVADDSTNATFILPAAGAPEKLHRATRSFPAGSAVAIELPGIRLDLRPGGEGAADAPAETAAAAPAAAEGGTRVASAPPAAASPPPPAPPEPPAQEAEPAAAPVSQPPVTPVQLAPHAPNIKLFHDNGTTFDVRNRSITFTSGEAGVKTRTAVMAALGELMGMPMRPGRALLAAIGASDKGLLALGVPADPPQEVKVNRALLRDTMREIRPLDTIEIAGHVFRAVEDDQRYLVCSNCNMSNEYNPSVNCVHCGTRLLNAVTRVAIVQPGQ